MLQYNNKSYINDKNQVTMERDQNYSDCKDIKFLKHKILN